MPAVHYNETFALWEQFFAKSLWAFNKLVDVDKIGEQSDSAIWFWDKECGCTTFCGFRHWYDDLFIQTFSDDIISCVSHVERSVFDVVETLRDDLGHGVELDVHLWTSHGQVIERILNDIGKLYQWERAYLLSCLYDA